MQSLDMGLKLVSKVNRCLLGNKKLMIEKTIDVSSLSETSDQLAYDGKTPMYMAIDNQLSRNYCSGRYGKRE